MTDDLVAWLRARVDEDEAIAFATINATDRAKPPRWVYTDDRSIRDTSRDAILRVKHTWNQEAAHITRHDPARVLRDIEAKRAIVDAHIRIPIYNQWHEAPDGRRIKGTIYRCRSCEPLRQFTEMSWPCPTLRHLAAVYADHPEYDESWKP